MYQLTVASGGGTGNVGTNYEQLISKLMQADGDSCKYLLYAFQYRLYLCIFYVAFDKMSCPCYKCFLPIL